MKCLLHLSSSLCSWPKTYKSHWKWKEFMKLFGTYLSWSAELVNTGPWPAVGPPGVIMPESSLWSEVWATGPLELKFRCSSAVSRWICLFDSVSLLVVYLLSPVFTLLWCSKMDLICKFFIVLFCVAILCIWTKPLGWVHFNIKSQIDIDTL